MQPSTPPPSGYGPRRDAFVTTLYHDILGRLPESSREKFWSRRLARGATTRGVALSIWCCSEHRQLKAPDISFQQAYQDAMKASKDVRLKKAALPAGPLALKQRHR